MTTHNAVDVAAWQDTIAHAVRYEDDLSIRMALRAATAAGVPEADRAAALGPARSLYTPDGGWQDFE